VLPDAAACTSEGRAADRPIVTSIDNTSARGSRADAWILHVVMPPTSLV
jgi:hypothetical protein